MSFELILAILVVAGFAALYLIGKEQRREAEQGQADDRPSRPLTFGSIVGAIVVGNLLSALIAAVLWAILFDAAINGRYELSG